MATYYVSTTGNDTVTAANNSISSPWKTLHLSTAKLAAGDTLIIRGGTYSLPVNGELVISVNNAIVRAQTGETVIVDGRATWGTVATAWGGLALSSNPVGTGEFQPLLKVSGSGVTVRNITFKNSGGEGVRVEGANAELDGVATRYTHGGGLRFDSGGDGGYAVDCISYKACVKGSGQGMGTRFADDVIFEDCTTSYCAGEGMSLIITDGSVFRRCTSYDNRKVNIYLSIATNCIVEKCLVYNTAEAEGGSGGEGIHVTAESPPDLPVGQKSESYNLTIRDNYAIGNGTNLKITGGVDRDDFSTTPIYNPDWGLDGLRIFHNAFIDSADGLQNVIISNKLAENNAQNTPCWFVNNLVVQRDNTALIGITSVTTYDKFTVRNNLYSKGAVAAFTHSSNIISSPGIVSSAFVNLASPSAFNIANYKLAAGSAAIGAGTTAQYAGAGITIGSDYFSATRTAPVDIGAHEFSAATSATITASATFAPTSGDVPITVAATNTSTATREIATTTYNWGDGGSNIATGKANLTHLYSVAGTYTITITVADVNGLTASRVYTDAITVNSPGGGGGAGNVAYKVGSFAIDTASASQTVAHGLSETPKAIIFVVSNGTANGTEADNAMLSIGAAASDGQWSISGFSKTAQATTLTRRRQSTTAAIHVDSDSYYRLGAVTFDATNIYITWSSTPSTAQIVGYLAIGGSAVTASCDTTDLDAVGVGVPVAVGFTPTVLIAGSVWDTLDAQTWAAATSLGIVTATGQIGASYYLRTAQTETQARAVVQTDAAGTGVATPFAELDLVITSTGYTMTQLVGAETGGVGVLALRFDGPAVYAAIVDSPTSTGNTDSTAPGVELGALLSVYTAVQTADTTISTGDAGTFAVGLYDGTSELTAGIADEDNVTPTDSQSLTVNALEVAADTGTTMFAGATTFVTDGYRRAMTTTDGTARKWLVLGFEEASADPIAGFSLNATVGKVDVTEFVVTDLSDDNGLGTITYDYDWDDGTTHSTTAEPSHTYTAAGTYTITQTVTAGGNSDTYTKDVTVTKAAATVSWTITGATESGYVAVGSIVTITSTVTPASGLTITNYAWRIYTNTGTVYSSSGAAATSISRVMATLGTFGVELKVTQSDGQITTYADDGALIVVSTPIPDFTVTLIGVGETADDGTITAGMPATVRIADDSSTGTATILDRTFTFTNASGTVIGTVSGKTAFDFSFGAQGTYTIAQAITTNVGTVTEIKTNAVVVPYGETDIIGPPYPTTVATWTGNDIRGDYLHTHAVESTTTAEANTLIATDARGGIELGYLAVNGPLSTLYNSALAPVMRLRGYLETAGPDSGLAGNSIKIKANVLEPYAGYSVDLGSQARKWASLYAANLLVETLVAAEVKADIGGRVIVGSTNQLADELSAVSQYTAILLRYDTGIEVGDYLWFEGGGSYEMMKVASTPKATTDSEGEDAWTLQVERTATRADWAKGAACINTGGHRTDGVVVQTGWIDLYARNSMGTTYDDLDGPTIVGNVRFGVSQNDYDSAYALGNLRGRYGQDSGSNVWGVAIGWDRSVNAYMVALPDAITFYGSGREELVRFSATNGLVMIGGDSESARNALVWKDPDGFESGLVSSWQVDGATWTRVKSVAASGNAATDLYAYAASGGTGSINLLAASGTGGLKGVQVVTTATYSTLIFTNLPTSSAGLPSGALYNSSGTVKVV